MPYQGLQQFPPGYFQRWINLVNLFVLIHMNYKEVNVYTYTFKSTMQSVICDSVGYFDIVSKHKD